MPWASALKNLTAVGISQGGGGLKALERVGLAGEEDTFPASLSGGMRRRLPLPVRPRLKPIISFSTSLCAG